jgi:hypothetical protein
MFAVVISPLLLNGYHFVGIRCLAYGLPELPDKQDDNQSDAQQVPNVAARFLRVTIASGWDDVACVFSLHCEGRTLM